MAKLAYTFYEQADGENVYIIPVIFSAAFMAQPVRLKLVSDDLFNYVDTVNLPISDSLKISIDSWNEKWQATLADYPPDSKFESPEAAISHVEMGYELAERLQNELGPMYFVQYHPNSINGQ